MSSLIYPSLQKNSYHSVDADLSSSSSNSSSISTSTTSHDSLSSNDHQQQNLYPRKRNYTQQPELESTFRNNRQRPYANRQSLIARSLNRGNKIWQEAILEPDHTLMPWTKYCNDDKYASEEQMLEPSPANSTPSVLHAYYREHNLYPL